VVSIVLRIHIVLIEVLFVIDFKIAQIMLMKLTVNTVGWINRLIEKSIWFKIDHQRPPLTFRSKIILFCVLLTIISFDISSILICYFCCGISNHNRLDVKERKSASKKYWIRNKNYSFSISLAPGTIEEGGAVVTPLLQSTDPQINDQSNWIICFEIYFFISVWLF
jgi:hypothetical protein